MPPVTCCGKERTSRFCPDCGKQLQQDHPLLELLSHCRKMAESHRKSLEKHKKIASDPNHVNERQNYRERVVETIKAEARLMDLWRSRIEAIEAVLPREES